eukprot:6193900-Pleurochrysis_carterae.AAC.1
MASWRSLGLVEELCSAARKVGAEIPTQIQTIAIPKLLEGHHAAIAAATGTGKTLAYLLPMMQRIKQAILPIGRTATTCLLRMVLTAA